MNTTGKEGYWLIVQGLRPGLNDGEEPKKEVSHLPIATAYPKPIGEAKGWKHCPDEEGIETFYHGLWPDHHWRSVGSIALMKKGLKRSRHR